MSDNTTETKRQPIVDPNHQRAMNAKRDERRNIVFACMLIAQKNAMEKVTPGIVPFWSKEELRELVPDAHKHTVEQFIGDAFEQKWITTGTDENGIADLERFSIVPQGAGVFRAAYEKVGATLKPREAAMASGSAGAKK